jgi:arabinose-5-phosphate isomerase
MQTGKDIPMVSVDSSLNQALEEMSRKGLGMTTIVGDNNTLAGVFTDGDLRRLLDHGEVRINELKISDVMHKDCKTINKSQLAAEALQLMESKSINGLPVIDENSKVIGALNMHNLLRAGVV